MVGFTQVPILIWSKITKVRVISTSSGEFFYLSSFSGREVECFILGFDAQSQSNVPTIHACPFLNSKTILESPFHTTLIHSMSELDSKDALFYRHEQAQRTCLSLGPINHWELG